MKPQNEIFRLELLRELKCLHVFAEWGKSWSVH